jgi:hypothetical protein
MVKGDLSWTAPKKFGRGILGDTRGRVHCLWQLAVKSLHAYTWLKGHLTPLELKPDMELSWNETEAQS